MPCKWLLQFTSIKVEMLDEGITSSQAGFTSCFPQLIFNTNVVLKKSSYHLVFDIEMLVLRWLS